VAYSLGYTGLGVGASRFGARVMLDLLSGHRTELTELTMVRSKPSPFPPEPLAYLGIQATRVTGRLGTVERPGHILQATYDGHPLYSYIGDPGPGTANGDHLDLNGGLWYEVRVSG
jgi:hypothetical protein